MTIVTYVAAYERISSSSSSVHAVSTPSSTENESEMENSLRPTIPWAGRVQNRRRGQKRKKWGVEHGAHYIEKPQAVQDGRQRAPQLSRACTETWRSARYHQGLTQKLTRCIGLAAHPSESSRARADVPSSGVEGARPTVFAGTRVAGVGRNR